MKPSREVATPLVDLSGLYERHAAHVHRFAVYLSGDPAVVCWRMSRPMRAQP